MKRFLSAIFLVCISHAVFSQYSTLGMDFWLSFGNNSSPTLQVRMVAPEKTNVTISFTETNTSQSITLEAGTVYTKQLSLAELNAVYSNFPGTSSKSMHIEADKYISVYAINTSKNTTDATVVLPTTALGTAYYQMSFQPTGNGYSDGYTLVATENNTDIYQNNVYQTTLNKGEVYSWYNDSDLTGTYITSSKNIAYFVTNSCVQIPVGHTACDCLYEQLFPVNLWGKSFLVPASHQGKDRVRILASQNGTNITLTNGTIISGSLTGMNTGEYAEIEIKKGEGCFIESNNPVAVAAYLTSMGYLELSKGDPALAWIPPIEQSVPEVIIAPFIAAGTSVIDEHYILITVPTAYKNITTIQIGNGSETTLSGGQWTDTPKGYSYYSLELTQANATYKLKNRYGLTVMGYGIGERESYYYLAASGTRSLKSGYYLNDTYYQDIDNKKFCVSSDITIKALIQYKLDTNPGFLTWYIDGAEYLPARDIAEWKAPVLTNGNHSLKMIAVSHDYIIDTVESSFEVMNVPDIQLKDTIICAGTTAVLSVLNAIPATNYQWHAGTVMVHTGDTFVTAPLENDTVFYVNIAGSSACVNEKYEKTEVKVISVTLTPNQLPIYTNDTPYNIQLISNAVSPLYTYTGSLLPGFTLSSSGKITGSVPLADGFMSTDFTVTVTDPKGCKAQKQYTLRGCEAAPVIPKADITYCQGETPVALQAQSPKGYELRWYNNNLQMSSLLPETNVPGKYAYFVTQYNSEYGCESIKAEMNVEVFPLPEAQFKNMTDKTCHYSHVNIVLDSLNSLHTYHIYSDNALQNRVGTINQQPYSSVLTSTEADTYFVTVTDTSGCTSKPEVINVDIITLSFVTESFEDYTENQDYEQKVETSADKGTYSVINGDLPQGLYLSQSGILHGKAVPGIYYDSQPFTIQVEDMHGCKESKQYVIKQNLFIPKVFTPNGDGINDYFMQGYKVSIFDRLGILVFEGDNGWDGTMKNKMVKPDIYFYKLYYKDSQGNSRIKTGYIGIE